MSRRSYTGECSFLFEQLLEHLEALRSCFRWNALPLCLGLQDRSLASPPSFLVCLSLSFYLKVQRQVIALNLESPWISGSIKPHRTDFCPDGDYYPWPRHRSDHLKGTRWIPSNSYEVFRGQSHGTRLETMISQTSPWPGLNYTGLPQLWFMFNIRSKVMPIPWRRTCGGRSPLLVPLPSVVTLNAFLSVFCNYPSL